MKYRVNWLIIILFFNVCLAKKDYMLISFPRSGSSFLFDVLANSNSNLKHIREYFSPSAFVSREEDPIGWQPLYHYEQECDYEGLQKSYDNTWKKSDCNFTKEVFAWFKIPFFLKYFTMVALYRHRRYTFSTIFDDRSTSIASIYDKLLDEKYNNKKVNQLIKYVATFTKTDFEKQLAAHLICWYVQFSYCQKYNIKIITYENIMTLSYDELKHYLRKRLPKYLYNKEVIDCLIKNKSGGELFLENRKKSYDELKLEPYCKKIIAFIQVIDPHFKYLNYLK